jgi:hypothetical protein
MTQRRPDTVTLKIPRPLYQRLQQLIAGTGFRSVTEFAVFVLRDLAAQPSSRRHEQIKSQMSPVELEAARARLRELGYL